VRLAIAGIAIVFGTDERMLGDGSDDKPVLLANADRLYISIKR
jgi:hypothetical protein